VAEPFFEADMAKAPGAIERLIETRDEEPLALTSHESKAIESLERIGHFEISTAKFLQAMPRYYLQPRSPLALSQPCG
jgi:hypothetical protein